MLRRFFPTLFPYAFSLRFFPYAPFPTSLILPEVSLHLPFPDSPSVVLPFFPLRFHEPLVDVIPQGCADHRVFLQTVKGLMEVSGQLVDSVLAALTVGHVGDVLVDGLARIDALLDPVQTRRQLDGQREVRVSGRAGESVFGPRRIAPLGGDAHEWRHVLCRPGDVDGGLEPRDEPLVRVDQRVRHGAVAERVPQQPPDVPATHVGELQGAFGVVEGVAPLGEQRLVGVHPGPVHAVERLRHERGDEAVAQGDVAHHEAQGGEVIGGGEGDGGAPGHLAPSPPDLLHRSPPLPPRFLPPPPPPPPPRPPPPPPHPPPRGTRGTCRDPGRAARRPLPRARTLPAPSRRRPPRPPARARTGTAALRLPCSHRGGP